MTGNEAVREPFLQLLRKAKLSRPHVYARRRRVIIWLLNYLLARRLKQSPASLSQSHFSKEAEASR